MSIFKNPYVDKGLDEDSYYELALSADLMLALGDLLSGKKVPADAVENLKGSWQRAKRTKLPYATLDWAMVEYEATRQGVSVADVLFDRMGKSK